MILVKGEEDWLFKTLYNIASFAFFKSSLYFCAVKIVPQHATDYSHQHNYSGLALQSLS